MEKKCLLITGATGLVGSNLIRKLSLLHDVHAIVRSKPRICDSNIQYYEMDLVSDFDTDTCPEKIDAVIHLAQSNQMREFPAAALDIFNVNVKTTAQLLHYAQKAGASQFIFASTGGLYGAAHEAFDEQSSLCIPGGPLGYYFRSKVASENLVQAYADMMSIKILRPFFIYGANQKKGMLLPRLVENIRNRTPVTLQGENGIAINPVHVNDVVQLITNCLSISDSLTINLAGPGIHSIRNLAEIIGKNLSISPSFTQVEGEANNILSTHQLMSDILNQPLTSFETGVLDLL